MGIPQIIALALLICGIAAYGYNTTTQGLHFFRQPMTKYTARREAIALARAALGLVLNILSALLLIWGGFWS